GSRPYGSRPRARIWPACATAPSPYPMGAPEAMMAAQSKMVCIAESAAIAVSTSQPKSLRAARAHQRTLTRFGASPGRRSLPMRRKGTGSIVPLMPGARDDRRAYFAIAGLIALGVAVRMLVLRSVGFPADVSTFEAWAEHLVQVGPAAFYSPDYLRDFPPDYPPVYLYVLWVFGTLFDGELLRLAIKAVSIPADVAIAIGAALLTW